VSVEIELHGQPTADGGAPLCFIDADLPAGKYCFHVGAGGELIVLVEERGESRVERVYSPTAWHSVRGDVWRKGVLLQG
jgi:hypothetical protein